MGKGERGTTGGISFSLSPPLCCGCRGHSGCVAVALAVVAVVALVALVALVAVVGCRHRLVIVMVVVLVLEGWLCSRLSSTL